MTFDSCVKHIERKYLKIEIARLGVVFGHIKQLILATSLNNNRNISFQFTISIGSLNKLMSFT